MTDRKEEKTKEYRTWCCWNLDEEEIYHVLGDIINSKNPVGLLSEDEIQEIVEDFKDRLSIAFEEWEENLKEVVENIIGERKKKYE